MARMVTALLASWVLAANPSVDLNARGEDLLKNGRSREALKLFKQASEADPRSAPSFFNQALALASLRKQPAAHPQPSKKDVLDAAEAALQLDPKMRERAEQELPAVRTTFRGQKLLGRTVEKDALKILEGIVWHSRSGERIEFIADGSARFLRDITVRPARWTADGPRVILEVGGRKYEGRLDTDGVLTFEVLGRFFDW
jgi:hypothetical protein